ncbi:choice-of-anchor D domain-containing protein [Hoeflea ulvae]|uniref:Choice-of-anchor D domain-containing protein n=1 Tax=Hoeflea ulvae TaxID=2983764 RepID=A0ABT3YCV2_9HYPH|nr:choice-of-anchor D domain-containing protein [Hoeflea ulvae]MCY0093706.1 choice-of-anchor D domain-containing protein [Hoeflea ulvae]
MRGLYTFLTIFSIFIALSVGLGVRAADAAWNSCSGLTVTTGGDLTLDVTADTCSLSNTFPGSQNYINFNAGSGSSVTIDLIGIDDNTGEFTSVSIAHDGGTQFISDGSSFGQANDFSSTYNCSSGCVVSGNYSGASIGGPFSVTYTQNGGSGSIGAPSAPEIAVSSSVSGAVSDGGTDAQGTRTAGSPVMVTYTVTNSGTSDLTLATATSSSANNVTVNSIGAPGSTTVTSGGGTTTFQVQYTPTLAGAFSFGLSFVNDDGDENPFNFTVSGTATGTPEIAVSSSISGTVADAGTDAQGTQVAGSQVTVTYTVTNSGTDALTLATATSSGASNVTVDSIAAPASTTVAGGDATTSFVVKYTPTLAGAFSFGLSFVNDDGDENPFNYTVSGTATGTPEIAVSSSEGGAVTDGGTDAQGTKVAGSPVTVTYTVTNSGTDDLTLATATASGASNVTVDSVAAPLSTTVTSGGGTTTFQVQYTPTTAGAFSFGLSFVNDDGDENPFNFTVSGTASGAPEIAVSSSISGTVADAGTDAQGTQVAGSQVTVTYTVTNSGTGSLTLATAISSSPSNVTVDSIGAPASTTVAGGGATTTFVVKYTPTLAGAFSFGLSFVNDDGDENPFNYTVSGTATGTPEIAVSSSVGGAMSDAGTDAQGTRVAGSHVTVTYTVTNSGTDDLTLATATASGASNVTVDSVAAPLSTTVTGGSSTTFQVRYTPTLAGAFSFSLSFVNDDGDENPFNFTVSGTATGAPEIAVSSSIGGAVSDGGTDAQGAQTAGIPVTVTYTVTNSGTDDLTLATATALSPSNVVVGSIGAPASTTVTGGGATTTFQVQYTPTLAGAYSFNLSFVNDDGDENPFNFTVSGTAGGTPEIAVSSSVSGAIADSGSDAQGTRVAGTPVTVTYTVTNSGTGDLTLATATSSSLSNVTVGSIGAPVSTTVAGGGGTTTFQVQYTPTLAGAFSFGLSFVNNDGDENPFDMTVSGTATGTPEIAVSSSIGGVVSDGGANAQGAQMAGTPVTVTYTVTNSGTDDLTLATATSSSLSNVTVNAIGAPGAATVTGGGGSTTFQVQYTPILDGAFSFDLAFTNNDGDENPFNMTVSGTAAGAPEIAVSSSVSGAVADGGTDAAGSASAGVQKTITYTVTNTGTKPLNLTGTATASAATNVNVDAISAYGSSSIAVSGSTTFTVAYTPAAAAAFSFELDIISDDADEANYDLSVSGTGVSLPAAITVSAGNGQTTEVNTGFATALSAKVVDHGDNPVSGVTVTFTAPATGAGLDTASQTATTNASGVASLSATANATAGAFIVNASAAGISTTADFSLTLVNNAPPKVVVAASSGDEIKNGSGNTLLGNRPSREASSTSYTIRNNGIGPLVVASPTLNSASNIGGMTLAFSNVSAVLRQNRFQFGDPVRYAATGVTASVTGPTSVTIPAGGSVDLLVTYTPASSGTFSYTLGFITNDSDEVSFELTSSGTASVASGILAVSGSAQSAEVNTRFDAPLVAKVTDTAGNAVAGVNVTFAAPASGPSLTFAATGSNTETVTTDTDGIATSSVMTANSITPAFVSTGVYDTYLVSASATGLTGTSFELFNKRDSVADIQKTQEVIASFVTNRADRIVAEQPDIVKRLMGGAFAQQRNFNGFSVEVTPYGSTGQFDFSLGAFRHRLEQGPAAAAEAATALGYATDTSAGGASDTLFPLATDGAQANQPQGAPRSGFDVWASGTYAQVENSGSDSLNALIFAGVDYRFGNQALVGVMGSLDITEETNATANSSADGVGWMIGPYAAMRVHQNLFADMRLTYGQSANKVNALGLFEDDFDTERLLMQAGLTGDFDLGRVRVNPFARLTYFWEEQKSYVDTLGNTIPGQEFDLGRLEFGPKLTIALEPMEDTDMAFSLGLSGLYDFDLLTEQTATNPSLVSADRRFRGRVEGGVEVRTGQRGVRFAGDLFYDGIGVQNYHAYGGTLSFSVPF